MLFHHLCQSTPCPISQEIAIVAKKVTAKGGSHYGFSQVLQNVARSLQNVLSMLISRKGSREGLGEGQLSYGNATEEKTPVIEILVLGSF